MSGKGGTNGIPNNGSGMTLMVQPTVGQGAGFCGERCHGYRDFDGF